MEIRGLESLLERAHNDQLKNLEKGEGKPIREWMAQAGARREVYYRFRHFLLTSSGPLSVDVDQELNLYQEKIKEMCQKRKASFEVDYNVLAYEC